MKTFTYRFNDRKGLHQIVEKNDFEEIIRVEDFASEKTAKAYKKLKEGK